MKIWKLTRWFNIYWWEYICAKPFSWITFCCRIKGHPNGSWYYNPHGLEPDDHCKDCGDLI
jgi:hypothetical protein